MEAKNQQMATGCFVLVLLTILIAWCSDTGPAKPHKVVEQSEMDGEVRQVKEYLKSHLNDWDSYESMEWSPMLDNGPYLEHRYSVRHKYRAKNGYGALVIENQMFVLDSMGNVESTRDWD